MHGGTQWLSPPLSSTLCIPEKDVMLQVIREKLDFLFHEKRYPCLYVLFKKSVIFSYQYAPYVCHVMGLLTEYQLCGNADG